MIPFEKDTPCNNPKCNAIIQGQNTGDCLNGKTPHAICKFVCPKCQTPAILYAMCGFRNRPFSQLITKSHVGIVSPQTIPNEIHQLIGQYLTTFNICETIIAEITADHDQTIFDLMNHQESGERRTPSLSTSIERLRKIPFISSDFIELKEQITNLKDDVIKFRDNIIHGSLVQVVYPEFQDKRNNPNHFKITIYPDGKTTKNMLPNQIIGTPHYMKEGEFTKIDKNSLESAIAVIERMRIASINIDCKQTELLINGKPSCKNKACRCQPKSQDR